MTAALITDVELAAQLGLDLKKFHRLRRDNKWPVVKFGRTEYRFTGEQVAQIIALQTRGVSAQPAGKPSSGLTSRSAKAAS